MNQYEARLREKDAVIEGKDRRISDLEKEIASLKQKIASLDLFTQDLQSQIDELEQAFVQGIARFFFFSFLECTPALEPFPFLTITVNRIGTSGPPCFNAVSVRLLS